jgi:hypothetical protein
MELRERELLSGLSRDEEEDDRWGRRGEVFIPPVTQKTVQVKQTPEPPRLSPEPPRSARTDLKSALLAVCGWDN